MSEFVDNFIKNHREYFRRNRRVIESNKWNDNSQYKEKMDSFAQNILFIKDTEYATQEEKLKKLSEVEKEIKALSQNEKSTKAGLFKQENELVKSIYGRLAVFIKEADADRKLPKTQKFIDETVDIINLHISKCDEYLHYNETILTEDSDTEVEVEYKSSEIMFQDSIFNAKIELQEGMGKLNIANNIESETIRFHKDQKAPLLMKEPLELRIDGVKELVERIPVDWSLRTSKEMYINMNPKDIPKWNHKKHFFEQDPVVLQFWSEEIHKINHGVTIGGYFIHPWLYFHLNFFRTPIVQPDGSEPNLQPDLRDNEWFFAENLKASINKDNPAFYSKALLVYGTRRFGKSVILASLAHWRSITKFNSFGTVIGGSSADINSLTSKIKTSMSYIDKPLQLEIQKQEWENGETTFGIKIDASNPIVYSTLIVQNLESGVKSKTQKTAGLAPSVSIYDEIGKYAFLKPYLAALPSFKTPYGFKCITVLAGCVCAGTKVWDNYGNLRNIEDIKPEKGILGFNLENQELSLENITYWQPPHEKICYRIITNTGRYLDCSEDHPILYRSRNETFGTRNYRKKKMYFKETKDIKLGDQVAVIEQVDIFGNKSMWSPRLVGLLIGDGSYGKDKTPVLSNCDSEINSYVYSNFDVVEESSYLTKKGKIYKETRIKNICQNLRELGIYGQTKDKKTLPTNIHSYKKEDICEMIGGFFDSDGTVQATIKNNNISLTSAYSNILLELQLLLQKLGIHGGIKFCKPNKKNTKDKNGCYRLTIADRKSVNEFYKNIKFLCKYKQDNLERVILNLSLRKNHIPKETSNLRFERVILVECLGLKPVYNLTAGTTHTYIANGIVTHNTGGEADLSKDATDVLSNPEAFDLLPMDWDLLESKIDPEHISWKRRKFATFFPGQMAYEEGFIKSKTTFSNFLKVDDPELDKIEIHTTNWEKNSKFLTEKIAQAKEVPGSKGRLLVQQRQVQFPTDPEHCFMSSGNNPFPVEEAKRHRDYIISIGDTGKKVILYEDKGGNIKYEISTKELAEFPFEGGFIDCPVVLYEELPTEKPLDYMYVGGFDDYKQEEAGTSSLGSFHIYKVKIGMDKYSGTIVASLATRPDPHTKLHRQIYYLMRAFNAKCFMENADMDFKAYLDKLRVTDYWLVKSMDFKGDLALESQGRRKYGWAPTGDNIKFLFGLFLKYCKQEYIINEGTEEERTVLGVELIKDVGLLNEIIMYKPGLNVDRITSAMSCLGFEFYLFVNYMLPDVEKMKRKKQEENKKQEPQKSMAQRLYGASGRRNPF